MQTNKLGISQKIFAQLERLFRKPRTQEVSLSHQYAAHRLTFPQASPLTLPTGISAPTCQNTLSTINAAQNHIVDLSTPLSPLIVHLRTAIPWPNIHTSLDLNFSSPPTTTIPRLILPLMQTKGFSCQIAPRSIRIQTLDLHPYRQALPSHSPLFTINQVTTHFNRLMTLKIPVNRYPIPSGLQSKPELRICWRKAVQKTKLSPQELKQMAFFSGVPLKEIKKIEFKLDPIHVTYWLKDNPSKSSPVSYLTLFRNEKDKSFFLTSSSDE